MNKISLIIGREYFTRVKKKSFLITTILVPLIIIGFYVAIFAISVNGSDDVQKIAVIDEAHIFLHNKLFDFCKSECKFLGVTATLS